MTGCESCPGQLPAFVTVTVYVVVTVGDGEIVCVVAPPGFQEYESNPAPASSVICWPAQLEEGPVIAGARLEATPTQPDSADIGVSAVPGQSFVAVPE